MRTLIVVGLLALLALSIFIQLRAQEAELSELFRREEPGQGVEQVAAVPELARPGARIERPLPDSKGEAEALSVAKPQPQRSVYALTGRVVDDRGVALANFVLTAESDGRELGPARLEGAGGFVLDGFRRGGAILHVTATGHVPLTTNVELPHGDDLELVLSRMARVSGQVLTEAGMPVPEAQVSVRRLVGESARYLPVATSGVAGNFSFEAPPGGLRVLARVARSRPSNPVELRLAPGESRGDLVIELQAGGTIEGFVEPLVADAGPRKGAIRAVGKPSYMRDFEVDEDGRFRIGGVPAGEFELSVGSTEAEVHAVLGERSSAWRLPRREAGATVIAGEVAHVDLPAGAFEPARVEGRVPTEFAGWSRGELVAAPPDEVLAVASFRTNYPPTPRAEFEPGEAFDFLLLPGRWELTTRLTMDGDHELRWMVEVDLEPGDHLRLDDWPGAGSLAGTARRSDGTPIARAWLLIAATGETPRIRTEVRTGEDGSYRLELPPGQYSVRLKESRMSSLDAKWHDRTPYLSWSRALVDHDSTPTLIEVCREGVEVTDGELTRADLVAAPGGGALIRCDWPDGRFALRAALLRGAQPPVQLRIVGPDFDHVARVPLGYGGRGLPRDGLLVAGGLAPGAYQVSLESESITLSGSVEFTVEVGAWTECSLMFGLEE